MNDLLPSAELETHIKTSESLVLVPAPDPVGIVTYGWGHRTYAGENVPHEITPAFAELTLQADMMKAAQGVRLYVTVDMTQGQFDACTDFAFNLGVQAFAGSTMLHRINAGDWAAAMTECRKWVHNHAGHVLGGLVTRREWDAVHMDPALTAQEVATTDLPDVIVADAPTGNVPVLTMAPDGTFVIPIDPDQAAINQQMVADFKSEGTMQFVEPNAGDPATSA